MKFQAHQSRGWGRIGLHSMKAMILVLAVLVLTLPTLYWSGCSQPQDGGTPGKRMTHVITTDTPYYLSGPQQGRPPDGTLRAGTEIMVVKNQGSYSVVRTQDGLEAHLSSDSFKPRTP